MKHLGMYIHIPFCKRKCYYCDFYSVCENDELIEPYFKCLNQELLDVGKGIKLDVQNGYKDEVQIKTIYIGGGTPSYVDSNYIVSILKTVKEKYNILDNAEITIEVNPGTVTREKLEAYKKVGINRLSIGMQSSNNAILERIGRIHSWDEFLHTFKLAREIGFNNINIDCMLGLPDQTIEDIKETINKVIELNPEHISVYSLIVEENTKLEKMLDDNEILLPDEETERTMYWIVKQQLENNGYAHYEISNFAKPGYESKHNLDCWHQKEYIGFGAGAHSYTDGCRYSNIDSIKKYIENYENGKLEDNIIFHEKQDKTAMAKEFILLSLRTIQGCNKQAFYEKFGYDLEKGFLTELKKLIEEKLIIINKDNIFLTDRGIDLANLVWREFI